jgi:leader peptidase (prepilin peptidase)/N-methyltransferase
MISSFTGTIVGISIIKTRKRKLGVKIPYGPYLALAAVLWLLAGKWMIHLFLSKISYE